MLGIKQQITDPFSTTSGNAQMGGSSTIGQMGDYHKTYAAPGTVNPRRAWEKTGASTGAPKTDNTSNQMGGFECSARQMG